MDEITVEAVLEMALAKMRALDAELTGLLRQWKPEKRSVWYEVDKVNHAAWQVHQAASTASRLIDLLHPFLPAYDRNARYIEIGKVMEHLGSWDLYVRFGWKYKEEKKDG